MKIGDICTRNPVVAEDGDSALYAAKLMRQYHVGSLVVISREIAGIRPVGIITDRDLVVQAIAEDVDLDQIVLGDIMAPNLIIARESDSIHDTIECLSRNGIRRVPVTDERGYLTGILTMDDLLGLLAKELGGLAALINREQAAEEKLRASL